VAGLRSELERIVALVAERESDLARLLTALEVVGALPALHAAPVVVPPAGTGQDAPTVSAPVPALVPASVPVADGGDREAFTAAVLAAVKAGPVGGMRCRDVVEAMGQEVVPRRVERVRHHGKRLVERGQLAETRGVFTLPPQRRPTRG
jgi:hypothetical protein